MRERQTVPLVFCCCSHSNAQFLLIKFRRRTVSSLLSKGNVLHFLLLLLLLVFVVLFSLCWFQIQLRHSHKSLASLSLVFSDLFFIDCFEGFIYIKSHRIRFLLANVTQWKLRRLICFSLRRILQTDLCLSVCLSSRKNDIGFWSIKEKGNVDNYSFIIED